MALCHLENTIPQPLFNVKNQPASAARYCLDQTDLLSSDP
jgi:hypothetical protein